VTGEAEATAHLLVEDVFADVVSLHLELVELVAEFVQVDALLGVLQVRVRDRVQQVVVS